MFPHTPKNHIEISGRRNLSDGRVHSCRTDNSQLYLKTQDLRQRSKVSTLRFHLGSLSKDSHSEGSVVGRRASSDTKKRPDSAETSLERIHTFSLKVTNDPSNKSSVVDLSSKKDKF